MVDLVGDRIRITDGGFVDSTTVPFFDPRRGTPPAPGGRAGNVTLDATQWIVETGYRKSPERIQTAAAPLPIGWERAGSPSRLAQPGSIQPEGGQTRGPQRRSQGGRSPSPWASPSPSSRRAPRGARAWWWGGGKETAPQRRQSRWVSITAAQSGAAQAPSSAGVRTGLRGARPGRDPRRARRLAPRAGGARRHASHRRSDSRAAGPPREPPGPPPRPRSLPVGFSP